MKVYISLPISGYDIEERKAVARAAKQWLSEMETTGEVITPFEVCDSPGLEYAHCMGRDIEALLGCDLAVFLPGWRDSRGCCLEYHAAEGYGLAIMEVNDDKFYKRFMQGQSADCKNEGPRYKVGDSFYFEGETFVIAEVDYDDPRKPYRMRTADGRPVGWASESTLEYLSV